MVSGAGGDLFVGRVAESKRLRSVLDAGLAGPMTTVVVAGGAGVGKTSLVSRVVAQLESADAPRPGAIPVRLSATCLPLSTFAIPLLGMHDALRGAPAGWPESPELLERDRAVATAPVEVAGWLD